MTAVKWFFIFPPQQIPPATSCSLLTIFLLVSSKNCTPLILHPSHSFSLRRWAFWVSYHHHAFQPLFLSFFPLLFSPFSVLPLLPPVFLSPLSRVHVFSWTDTCEGDLELSMVRHQPEGLDQLQAQTQFTRKELQSLYRGFKNVRKQLETLSLIDNQVWLNLIE